MQHLKLLKFSASWCKPCQKLRKMIEQDGLADIIEIEEIDVEEDADRTESYNVRNVPTVILVTGNGEELRRWSGVTPTPGNPSGDNGIIHESPTIVNRKSSNRK